MCEISEDCKKKVLKEIQKELYNNIRFDLRKAQKHCGNIIKKYDPYASPSDLSDSTTDKHL